MREWHETYSQQGLVIIGNHYPEFSYEHNLDNLQDAIGRLDVPYAVLQDNKRQTWGAFNNRYWPTIYLIDKQGQVRYTHIGEGAYARTEKAIQALLVETYVESDAPAIPWSLTALEPLNVRTGPGTEYERIGRILPNEAYYIVAERDGWYQILYDGSEAFVSGEYVRVNLPETSGS